MAASLDIATADVDLVEESDDAPVLPGSHLKFRADLRLNLEVRQFLVLCEH